MLTMQAAIMQIAKITNKRACLRVHAKRPMIPRTKVIIEMKIEKTPPRKAGTAAIKSKKEKSSRSPCRFPGRFLYGLNLLFPVVEAPVPLYAVLEVFIGG